MKSCPTCNRTYPDDTLAFCLIDGSVLSAPYDPQAKQQRANEPPPTEMFHPTPGGPATNPSHLHSTMPTYQPGYAVDRQTNHPTSNSSGKRWLAVGIAVFVVLIGGVGLLLVGSAWLGNRNSRERPSELKSDVPATSKSPESTPLPESSPSPEKLDVAGRWVGTSDESPATLVIYSSENDSYEGIETAGVAEVKIAVKIQVDPETRHITINETRIIEGQGGWNLGVNNGTISSSGNKMSGSARDVKGKTYSWSFTRQ
jgi:hypothetical protein